MFAIFVILFAANFLAAENFVIPPIVEGDSISIQTSTSQNIVENVLGDTMSMGSSMQSTVENIEMNITDIDSPLENMVEELVEESELEIVEDITGIGSGIGNISENMEILSENIEEVVSSPMGSLGSSLMTENIMSEMGSPLITPTMMGSEIIEEAISENISEMGSPLMTPMMMMGSEIIEEAISENISEDISENISGMGSPLITPTMMGSEIIEEVISENISEMGSPLLTPTMMGSDIIEETISENISEMESIIPYSMNNLSPMLNLPSTNTLSEMEEVEIISDIESLLPTSGTSPLSPITSQIGRNYISPMMESIPGMGNSQPNMQYLPNMRPSSYTMSQNGGNYISPLTESIPGMGNSPPNMQYLSNMRPSSFTTSQTGGNYISPLMESIPGMGNLQSNMQYPSMTGLTSPLTSSMQQLESQIGQSSPTMPYYENMSPLMPYPPGMSSSMQGLESEFGYTSPGSMLSGMGNTPMMPYPSNKGLLSPITSTIKEVESEIEESSIPLMNLINQSPFAPPTMGPVISLPSLGTTLEELEEVTTSNIPLIGSTLGGNSLPMKPTAPKMPPMEALINVPSIGSALSQLEQGINSSTLPLMDTMPIIGNSLPFLQKPTMGGYQNFPNKENIRPQGPLSPSITGSMPGSGSGLPLIGNMISPFQNLPLMNRFVTPLMNNLSNMQQPMSPGGGLLSPLRQAMSTLKKVPSMSNMLNMGPNSMMSNAGLSELTSLINQDSQLPSSQKNQFLNQISNLSPSSLEMIGNMYSMMGNSWQSRLRRQIEKVRQARRELFSAIECFMSGDEQGMRQHILAAISALGNSPITTALQYAMNQQDSSMLSLYANMSRLILDRVQ